MENKHTKGKWEICPNGLVIVKHGTLDVISDCDTTDIKTSLTFIEMRANAKLIAASPDLLEALIKSNDLIVKLSEKLSEPKYGIIISDNLIQNNINAINKATK